MAKPPPPGWENHPWTPGLIRKVQPKSAAQSMYPYLRSEQEKRDQERVEELKRKKERK
jgi:hypothetical protein